MNVCTIDYTTDKFCERGISYNLQSCVSLFSIKKMFTYVIIGLFNLVFITYQCLEEQYLYTQFIYIAIAIFEIFNTFAVTMTDVCHWYVLCFCPKKPEAQSQGHENCILFFLGSKGFIQRLEWIQLQFLLIKKSAVFSCYSGMLIILDTDFE